MLSKVDLIEAYGNLDFALDFYTDVLDPSRLLPMLQAQAGDSAFARQHAALNGGDRLHAALGARPTSRLSRTRHHAATAHARHACVTLASPRAHD